MTALRLVLWMQLVACAQPLAESARALPVPPPARASAETFRGVPVETIDVVTVDGRTIGRERVDERMAAIRKAHADESNDALRVRAIEALVDDALVREAAARFGISLPPDILERAKQTKMHDAGWTDAEWAAELDRRGVTEAAVEHEWEGRLLRAKVGERAFGPIQVDEGDERAAYDAFLHREPFKVELETLYLDAKDATLAASIVARARGGEDFCKLVAAYSTDTLSKSNCGHVGPTEPKALVPEMEGLVSKMKDGDVASWAVKDHIVVIHLHRVIPSFDDVRAQMHDEAMEQREQRSFDEWIKNQRAHAHIETK
jgi:parvulin-like peptidyl-prolyl isomerase